MGYAASLAGDQAKAKALFSGMFEREHGNVSKGRFAQALAAQIEDEELDIEAPGYNLPVGNLTPISLE